MDLSRIPPSLQWFAPYAELLDGIDDGTGYEALSDEDIDEILRRLRPEF